MVLRLGCIADDFTGATDVANNLVRAGMRTVQVLGVPSAEQLKQFDVDAVVVALKSRTAPVSEAIEDSLRATRALRECGAHQIYFKYCSTFDSTPSGNIGPVTDALMAELDSPVTIATPAFPATGRTIFHGHLFVGNQLLSDSGMKDHPLTPMTDSNLVRVLAAQTSHPVISIPLAQVRLGADAIGAQLTELAESTGGIAIVDAVDDDDLVQLAEACSDLPLVTAASGLATGLPRQWGFEPDESVATLPEASGFKAVLAGSVSQATNAQVASFIETGGAARALDLPQLAAGADVVSEVLDWATPLLSDQPVLVYSTAQPEYIRKIQDQFGQQRSAELIEGALAAIAVGLVEAGVGQLLTAGGETSGAIVQALGVNALQIGPQIDPGIPWCATTRGTDVLHLALKSGNFGGVDLFTRAFDRLGGQ